MRCDEYDRVVGPALVDVGCMPSLSSSSSRAAAAAAEDSRRRTAGLPPETRDDQSAALEKARARHDAAAWRGLAHKRPSRAELRKQHKAKAKAASRRSSRATAARGGGRRVSFAGRALASSDVEEDEAPLALELRELCGDAVETARATRRGG